MLFGSEILFSPSIQQRWSDAQIVGDLLDSLFLIHREFNRINFELLA